MEFKHKRILFCRIHCFSRFAFSLLIFTIAQQTLSQKISQNQSSLRFSNNFTSREKKITQKIKQINPEFKTCIEFIIQTGIYLKKSKGELEQLFTDFLPDFYNILNFCSQIQNLSKICKSSLINQIILVEKMKELIEKENFVEFYQKISIYKIRFREFNKNCELTSIN